MFKPDAFMLLVSAVVAVSFCPVRALNYFKWDCESTSATQMGSIKTGSLLSNSSLVAVDAHAGSTCMQISVIGNDGGNQSSGASGFGGFSLGNMCDGGTVYYRWWMKFDAAFRWGNGTAKAKANRIMRADQTHPVPATGYVHDACVLMGECPQCDPAGPDWCTTTGPCVMYNFRTAVGTGWHEYMVMFKKASSATVNDGEFHFFADGKKIGKKTGMHWYNENTPVLEAWGPWMIEPYWQMNGSSSDGGQVWFDDYSMDDTWNSSQYPPPEATVVNQGRLVASREKIGVVNLNGYVRFILPGQAAYEVSIFNWAGRKIWAYKGSATKATGGLSPQAAIGKEIKNGIYWVCVKQNGKQYANKFLVAK